MGADRSSHNPGRTDPLQFDVAEGSESASAAGAALTCRGCSAPIVSSYYHVNGEVVCARCRGTLDSDPTGSRGGRVLKAGGLGLLAAIGGSVLYYAVAAITGYELAIVAIAVGFMVGKAVRRGSGNRGGRAYQVLAIVLTYFAIVSTYIPLAVKEFGSKGIAADSARVATHSVATPRDTTTLADSGVAVQSGTATASPRTTSPASRVKVEHVGVGVFILGFFALLLFAAIIPILAGFSNIIGLIIIAVALFEAWKLNKRIALEISGPYRVGGAEGGEAGASG